MSKKYSWLKREPNCEYYEVGNGRSHLILEIEKYANVVEFNLWEPDGTFYNGGAFTVDTNEYPAAVATIAEVELVCAGITGPLEFTKI